MRRLATVLPRASGLIAVCLFTLAATGTPVHVELNASYPDADAVLSEAPTEVWLEFSTEVDMERTSFSIRGPDGRVALGDLRQMDDPAVVKATVDGAMPSGAYTVSWVAAPLEDHTVRGRYSFQVE
jgi:methionine-rich copper-binding protein CopC